MQNELSRQEWNAQAIQVLTEAPFNWEEEKASMYINQVDLDDLYNEGLTPFEALDRDSDYWEEL